VKVIKLDSVKTQLPYNYYSLPFCRPDVIEPSAENLGEWLSGDRIENSLYQVIMGLEENCVIVCRKEYSLSELKAFEEKVKQEYRVNWLLDNLPAATKYYTRAPITPGDETSTLAPKSDDTQASSPSDAGFIAHYEKGFALGFTGSESIPGSKPGVRYINNHLRLNVFYHQDAASFEGSRIVGFEVESYSIRHRLADGKGWVEPTKDEYTNQGEYLEKINAKNRLSTCDPHAGIPPQAVSGFTEQSSAEERTITFTYDVRWIPSEVKWASRWDLEPMMAKADEKIHLFAIVNAIMIALFLSGIVAVIMLRILRKDLARYNSDDMSEEEAREETGWKLLHGDVFRLPSHAGWFSVLVGTGVQVFAMALVTLIFAALGFLSPANRGGLMSMLLLCFVFMGMLAGYHSTRLYKMFHLLDWRKNTLITALFFPGLMFGVFFILDLFVWREKSSGAVPFGTLCALLVLWLGISVPLVYLGSYLAFRKPAIEPPTKVNNLARLLPPDSQQQWYTNPTLAILMGGILPFAAVFIEIYFIMSSVWLNQFYYFFGFLFLVFIILIITCAEVSIVLCYFQLCSEDYRWWWRSYLTAGSSALYLYLYSIFYFLTKLELVKFTSALLFFGYMFLVCVAFFVLTGTIGFFACFLFVRKIYSSIKID